MQHKSLKQSTNFLYVMLTRPTMLSFHFLFWSINLKYATVHMLSETRDSNLPPRFQDLKSCDEATHVHWLYLKTHDMAVHRTLCHNQALPHTG